MTKERDYDLYMNTLTGYLFRGPRRKPVATPDYVPNIRLVFACMTCGALLSVDNHHQMGVTCPNCGAGYDLNDDIKLTRYAKGREPTRWQTNGADAPPEVDPDPTRDNRALFQQPPIIGVTGSLGAPLPDDDDDLDADGIDFAGEWEPPLDYSKPPFVPDANGDAPGPDWFTGDWKRKAWRIQRDALQPPLPGME